MGFFYENIKLFSKRVSLPSYEQYSKYEFPWRKNENYLSFIRLEVQVVLDTHLLISVLTPFDTARGRKYCPHLCLEEEETKPYFSPESLFPSVCLHRVSPIAHYTKQVCLLY